MKKRILAVALVLAAIIGITAAPAMARSMISASDATTSVAKDVVVDGSAYLVGDTITVAGTVNGDVYCAGKQVVISGIVNGDVLCGGQNVTVSGTVNGDIRAGGMAVVVSGLVKGSVTLMGGTVTLDASSTIDRDATVIGGIVTLNGAVNRDVMMGASTVNITGKMGGDINGSVDALSVTAAAKVGGNVSYVSQTDASISSGVVAGTVERFTPSNNWSTGSDYRMGFGGVILMAFVAVMSFVVFALLFTLVMPRYVRRVASVASGQQFGLAFLIGIVAAIVIPAIMFMLALTIVGIYAALFMGVVYIMSLMLGAALVSWRLGQFMLSSKGSALSSAALGALTLAVVGLVPFIGWVVMFGATLTGVGLMVLDLRTQYGESAPAGAAETSTKKFKAKK